MSARKPPELRQNRETTDAPEDAPGAVAPRPAPAGLSESVETAWFAFWGIPALARKVAESDILPLVRLFQLYEVYRRSMDVFMATPYVDGYRGSPVVHPSWNVANSAMRQILPLEKQFGVTPKARAELGITLSEPTNPSGGGGTLDFTDDDDDLD